MTTLLASSTATSGTVTEGDVKTYLANLRDYGLTAVLIRRTRRRCRGCWAISQRSARLVLIPWWAAIKGQIDCLGRGR